MPKSSANAADDASAPTEWAEDDASEPMKDPTLFSPNRVIRATVDRVDQPPKVYEFTSRLTQAYVDEVNGDLVSQGQRPVFIRWEDVHLQAPARGRRRNRVPGAGLLSVLALLLRR